MMPQGQASEALQFPSRTILSLIGDKWTIVVLYCLSLEEVRRFNEMQRQIPDISKKMLVQTLRTLERNGLVERPMVLRSAASGGPRPAAYAAVGIALGCLVWGAAVSIGLGALLAASEVAFTIVKWAGAAYLLYLGTKLIMHPRVEWDGSEPGYPNLDPWQSLRQGLLTNLLNPKVGVFYITFLPQFIPAATSVAAFSFLLATIHVLLSVAWFTVLIAATIPMGRLLRRPNFVKELDRITGGVFIAFGAKLALSK
jgi:threonine/homoserine/homoserine lactone efflux protein